MVAWRRLTALTFQTLTPMAVTVNPRSSQAVVPLLGARAASRKPALRAAPTTMAGPTPIQALSRGVRSEPAR